jgi:hypothetical protein
MNWKDQFTQFFESNRDRLHGVGLDDYDHFVDTISALWRKSLGTRVDDLMAEYLDLMAKYQEESFQGYIEDIVSSMED